jgi:Uma2 family endonuclease
MSSGTIREPQASSPRVPPLQQGDHLTRDEFERRYDATPGIKKAELIEGIVYISPPEIIEGNAYMAPPAVRWDYHGGPHFDLVFWLGYYRAATPGIRGGDNSSVRLDLENEPQPDVCLFIDPDRGGAARLVNGYIEGAPELVAEVSASSVSIDLNAKLRVYRRNAVAEYLVWRVVDRTVDWFELRDGNYVPLPADADGIIRSKVFPGLWLATKAMIEDQESVVLDVLRQGLASSDHAQFVSLLQSRRPAP